MPPNIKNLHKAGRFCRVFWSWTSSAGILVLLPRVRLFIPLWMAHRKCVNIHGSLQCRHSSLNDWLPFCPLRLPAAVTRSPQAKRVRVCAFARHQFVSVKPCLCIQWSYFQIFIPWKLTLTSGEHILSGSWPFRPAEMNPAVYSCPPLYILLHEVYCVSLFIVAWHLAVREVRSKCSLGISEPLKRLLLSFFHFIVFVPVEDNCGKRFSLLFISGPTALISVFVAFCRHF